MFGSGIASIVFFVCPTFSYRFAGKPATYPKYSWNCLPLNFPTLEGNGLVCTERLKMLRLSNSRTPALETTKIFTSTNYFVMLAVVCTSRSSPENSYKMKIAWGYSLSSARKYSDRLYLYSSNFVE